MLKGCALVLAFSATAGTASAAPPAGVAPAPAVRVEGDYRSPLGQVRVVAAGDGYRGTLTAPARGVPFRAGDEVLRATLLDDSLAGQLRLPLAGAGCGQREAWASAVLLAAPGKLAGAASLSAEGCRSPLLGPRGGFTLTRAAGKGAGAPARAPSAARREKARALLRDGAAWLGEGGHEAARRRFVEAIAVDPGLPEAYNGVGVTYRMRDDLPAALDWYKRALAVDPDFGDAYYNMACVYALRGERALALRYLQIAALNGYETAATMEEDPDLAGVRDDPAYRALLGPAGAAPGPAGR